MADSAAEIAALNSLTGLPIAGQEYADAVMGPSMAGWQANIFLFGIFTHAFLCYTQTKLYKRDSWRTKALFWVVFFFGALEAGLNFEEVYHFGVNQQRDITTLDNGPFQGNFQPLLTGLVGLLVQSYLARRSAGFFSRNSLRIVYNVFMGVAILVSFAGCVLTTAIGFMYEIDTWEKVLPLDFNGVMSWWLWSSAIIDVVLSYALFWSLKNRLGHNRRTDNILVGFIKVGLKTAAPTALFALGGAAVAVAFANGDYLTADISYGLFLPLSSLYCISLITTLTSRVNLARHVGAVSDDGKDEDESNGTTDVASGVQIDVIQYVERDEPDGNIHEIRLNKSSRPRFDTWDRESKV